jgi:hypothetical protein
MNERIVLKSKIFLRVMIGTICLIIGGSGCDFRDRNIGVYEAVESGSGSPKEKIVIELKENGSGVWGRSDEEVPFSWYIKNDELRINTKDGGTMVGKIKKKGITVILPDEEEITFKKIQ